MSVVAVLKLAHLSKKASEAAAKKAQQEATKGKTQKVAPQLDLQMTLPDVVPLFGSPAGLPTDPTAAAATQKVLADGGAGRPILGPQTGMKIVIPTGQNG